MIWIALFILAVILIPNLYKLCTVSIQLIGFLPTYLQSVTADPTILGDANSRMRLQNAFTTIFFSIQTHALNVVAILLFGWEIWHRNEFALAPWLKIIISIVSIAACISSGMIARHLISEYRQVRETSRALEKLQSSIGGEESSKDGSLTMLDTIHVWSAISMYLASGLVSLCLLLAAWS